MLCGDLNDSRSPGKSAWLGRCLSSSGIWRGYRSPYPPGGATNLVRQAGSRSSREIEWVLVSADTPCVACDKVLLPGLCTHLGVLCSLSMAGGALRLADPSGRKFRLGHASESALLAAGRLVGLLMWWGVAAAFSPDSIIMLGWAGVAGSVPHTKKQLLSDLPPAGSIGWGDLSPDARTAAVSPPP